MNAIIPLPFTKVEKAKEKPTRTYRLDLDTGRIFGMTDGIEAVNQAIRKALLTPRFRCMVYDNQYGSEIKDMILTKNATREYIMTELPRMIKDALRPDKRILDIYAYSFSFIDDDVLVEFKVNTIFGETTVEEMI